MIILGCIILISWMAIVVFVVLKNREPKVILQPSVAGSGIGADRPHSSPFLKEQTIRLEDGSFGMRIEFLKHDLEFDELLQAGKQVFELKKFIQEARENKIKSSQIQVVEKRTPEIVDSPVSITQVEREYPDIEEKPDFNDVLPVTGDEIFEYEKYKLSDSADLLDINQL